MSDLDTLLAAQGRTIDDEGRRRIELMSAAAAQAFFRPVEPRPLIPEPRGTTDLWFLRKQQGWIEDGSGSIGSAIIFMAMAGLSAAGFAAFYLVK